MLAPPSSANHRRVAREALWHRAMNHPGFFGDSGVAAVYTDRATVIQIVRKIALRIKTWLNYVLLRNAQPHSLINAPHSANCALETILDTGSDREKHIVGLLARDVAVVGEPHRRS